MLLKQTDEITPFAAIAESFTFSTLIPHIMVAEEQFIIPLIGLNEYTVLEAAYQAGTLNATQAALYGKIQPALANLALYLGYAALQVSVSDAGITTQRSGEVQTAYQEQRMDLRKLYSDSGFFFLDEMLKWMELHKADYPLWTADTAVYTINKQFFINTATEFSQYVGINDSRRTFVALWPIIARTEDMKLRAVLGTAFMKEIKDRILAGTSTNDDKELFPYIKGALASLTCAKAITELSMELTPQGMMVSSFQENNSNSRKIEQAKVQERKDRREELMADGHAYLFELEGYLRAQASDVKYATYYASTKYIAPGSSIATVQQDDTYGFFAAL